MPEIVIVGPGAMGQLHAAALARAGIDVALLDYKPERAALLASRGIRLRWPDGAEQTIPVPCTCNAAELSPARFIVIFTKAWATGRAARHAASAAGPDTAWVTLQNGLGNFEAICQAAGTDKVLVGITSTGANVADDGTINVAAIGTTEVGPAGSATLADALALSGLFTKAGLKCDPTDDPWPAVWRKLMINSAINPVAALAGRRNGELVEYPWLFSIAAAAAREAKRAAEAEGISIDEDPAELVRRICELTAANRCSMLQDLQAGRRTEIDFINGTVVARLGPDEAPICAALTRLVHEAEAAAAGKHAIGRNEE